MSLEFCPPFIGFTPEQVFKLCCAPQNHGSSRRILCEHVSCIPCCSSKKEESNKKRPSSRGIRTVDSPMLLVWGDDVSAAPDTAPPG